MSSAEVRVISGLLKGLGLWAHYREAVCQMVKGLGFGVTVIRGPFVHGVNLGRWL